MSTEHLPTGPNTPDDRKERWPEGEQFGVQGIIPKEHRVQEFVPKGHTSWRVSLIVGVLGILSGALLGTYFSSVVAPKHDNDVIQVFAQRCAETPAFCEHIRLETGQAVWMVIVGTILLALMVFAGPWDRYKSKDKLEKPQTKG